MNQYQNDDKPTTVQQVYSCPTKTYKHVLTARDVGFYIAENALHGLHYDIGTEIEPDVQDRKPRFGDVAPLDLDPKFKPRAHAIMFEVQELIDRLEEIEQDYTSLRNAALRRVKQEKEAS